MGELADTLKGNEQEGKENKIGFKVE